MDCPNLGVSAQPSLSPSVSWNPAGNVGFEYDKEASASTRGIKFTNVGFRAPAPVRVLIPPGAPLKATKVAWFEDHWHQKKQLFAEKAFAEKATKKRQLEDCCEVERPRPNKRMKFELADAVHRNPGPGLLNPL